MNYLNLKKIVISVFFVFVGVWVYAEETNQNNSNNTNSGSEQVCPYGKCVFVTNVVSDFEQAGRWVGRMFSDHGFVQVQRKIGYAVGIDVDGVSQVDIRKLYGPQKSSFVLGMKVLFRRAYYSFAEIIPPRDIRLYGKVKKLSVWVLGKNIDHELYAEVEDARGKLYRAPFNSGVHKNLKFEGWSKLEAIIPEDRGFSINKADRYKQRVVQKNPNISSYYNPEGIVFKKFIVEFNAEYAEGVYYLYLDQFDYVSDVYEYQILKKLSDLPKEEISRPIDNW